MRHKRVRGMRVGIPGSIALMLALQGSWSLAETQVYKSTDADGRVTYGDAPTPGAVAVEDMGVTAPDVVVSEEELQKRIDRVAATTDRLRDDRLQREKARADARPPPAPAPPIVVMPGYASEPVDYFPPSFGYPGYNRHVYPHHGVPFSIDVQGGNRNFRYGVSVGHDRDRGLGAEHDYPDHAHHTDGPRPPYRQGGLLHNPRH
jgi:hypothetical protein